MSKTEIKREINRRFYTYVETNFPQYELEFDNGYGVSVICGFGAYGNNDKPYELAILKNGSLCYDTEITDDVIGYLTPDKVTEYMIRIQEL